MGDWGLLADQVMSQSLGDVWIPIRGRRILGLGLVHLSEGHLRYRACAVLHLTLVFADFTPTLPGSQFGTSYIPFCTAYQTELAVLRYTLEVHDSSKGAGLPRTGSKEQTMKTEGFNAAHDRTRSHMFMFERPSWEGRIPQPISFRPSRKGF